MPELGSKISLISKADIRYEGRLFTVDPQECTIALASGKFTMDSGISIFLISVNVQLDCNGFLFNNIFFCTKSFSHLDRTLNKLFIVAFGRVIIKIRLAGFPPETASVTHSIRIIFVEVKSESVCKLVASSLQISRYLFV